MSLIDYHVHTPLCNHAKGEMEAYVQQAVKLGLAEICFLDHLTLRPDGSFLSMSPQEVPLYHRAVKRLAAKYEDRIWVKVGLEVDFDLETMEQAMEIVDAHSFDAIGGSVHFIGEWNMVSHKERDNCPYRECEDMFAEYLDHLEAMAEHSFFDFLCHLDVVGKFGDSPQDRMEDRWDQVISTIAGKDIAVEINTSGKRHPKGELYPSLWILKKLNQAGVPITLGSDAHSPKQVGMDFDEAVSLAREAGYHSLATFSHRIRGEVSLSP
ncbi:histidinol phosphate phosphatase HisJ family [Desulfatibacillum aliphaticivorans]|uniref:Histidinol-phosphatase n=1 Tax=Desulfatibacillum aliphaticivorans TaxID=218208 RepID=B8FL10_DESAL|nr:histidinol-phosphatase [Desulfatibacillum aliphaticivorans]ACL04645.1 histidinol phosphate phosphatase HisJ family [Desulfatibacillum aliphaticivorans]